MKQSIYSFAGREDESRWFSHDTLLKVAALFKEAFGESLHVQDVLQVDGGLYRLSPQAIAQLGAKERAIADEFKTREEEFLLQSAKNATNGLCNAVGRDYSEMSHVACVKASLLPDGRVVARVTGLSPDCLPFTCPLSSLLHLKNHLNKGLIFFILASEYMEEAFSPACQAMALFSLLASPDAPQAVEAHLQQSDQVKTATAIFDDLTEGNDSNVLKTSKPQNKRPGAPRIIDVGERVEGAKKHKFENKESVSVEEKLDDSGPGLRVFLIEQIDFISKLVGETAMARIGSSFFRLAEEDGEQNIYFFPHGIVALRVFENHMRSIVTKLREAGLSDSQHGQSVAFRFDSFGTAAEVTMLLRSYLAAVRIAIEATIDGFQDFGKRVDALYADIFSKAIVDANSPGEALKTTHNCLLQQFQSVMTESFSLCEKASSAGSLLSELVQDATRTAESSVFEKRRVADLVSIGSTLKSLVSSLAEVGAIPSDSVVMRSAASWEVFLLNSNAARKASDLPEIKALKELVKRKAVAEFVRKGGMDVSDISDSASFQAKFGLRSLSWGNYVGASKREDLLYRGAASLADLATVLGMDIKSVSLQGSLALAFGERGSGTACATYFPGAKRHVINLTRDRGDGSLAHEWLHALDFGGKESGIGQAGLFTGARDDLPSEVLERMHEVRVALQVTSADSFLKRRRLEATEVSARALQDLKLYQDGVALVKEQHLSTVMALKKSFETASKVCKADPSELHQQSLRAAEVLYLDAVAVYKRDILRFEHLRLRGNASLGVAKDLKREILFVESRGNYAELIGERNARSNTSYQASRTKKLARQDNFAAFIAAQGEENCYPSKFIEDMLSLESGSKPYYTTAHEMAAYAFEAYLAGKMEGMDMENNYLVPEGIVAATTRGGLSCYPTGDERVRVEAAFDALIAACKKHRIL